MTAKNVILRLIGDPSGGHEDHELLVRHYPLLDAPAVFTDCLTCGVTWERGVRVPEEP